jgi:hypothetical protein
LLVVVEEEAGDGDSDCTLAQADDWANPMQVEVVDCSSDSEEVGTRKQEHGEENDRSQDGKSNDGAV